METMPLAKTSVRKGRVAALVAALAFGAFSPAALADTGGPLPQGYSTDGPAPPQAPVPPVAALPPATFPAPLQQVQQAPQTPDPSAAPYLDPSADPSADADPDQYADADPSALTDFQAPLAPYGQWTLDPTYGTLWVPDPAQVGADFAPYQSGGQWAESDGGDWMWQSDYSWGYIPFHYGRWVWAGNYWGWIPGRRYAPAWVTWRTGEGGYVGWAPLPPTWYWAGGRAFRLRAQPWAAYCFVPTNYAFARGVGAFVVRDRGAIQSIAASTRPYHPATPTMGGGPASPRLSEAHIPAAASPRSRLSADPRAMSFSSRSATATVRAGYAPGSFQVGRPTSYSLGRAFPSSGRSSASYQGYTRSRVPEMRTPGRGSVSTGVHTPSYYHPAVPPMSSFHPALPQAARPSVAPSSTPSTVGHTSSSHSSVHVGGHRR